MGTTPITATAENINNISGLTVNSSKLNLLSDVTDNVQDQINLKLDTNVASSTYSVKEGSANISTVGALVSGSLGAGFGNIEIQSNISTTKDVIGDKIKTNNLVLGDSTIGFTGDEALINLSGGSVNITGELQVSTSTGRY